MAAQAFQNKTQTKTRPGSRGKRRAAPPASGSRQPARGRHRKSVKSNKGARVIWVMMIVGGVIGAIFIFAQRSQINTLYLKRTEESLKSEIDTLASQQRYLNFQREKALSTQESDRAAGEFNLTQPGVGRTVAERTEPKPKAVSKTKAADKAKGAKAKVESKQSASAKQLAKVTKSIKVVAPGKGSKTVGPVKLAGQTKPAQANRAKKDTKQPARNQAAKNQAQRKEARR